MQLTGEGGCVAPGIQPRRESRHDASGRNCGGKPAEQCRNMSKHHCFQEITPLLNTIFLAVLLISKPLCKPIVEDGAEDLVLLSMNKDSIVLQRYISSKCVMQYYLHKLTTIRRERIRKTLQTLNLSITGRPTYVPLKLR